MPLAFTIINMLNNYGHMADKHKLSSFTVSGFASIIHKTLINEVNNDSG